MVTPTDPQSFPTGTPDTTLLDSQIEKALDKRDSYKASGGDGNGGNRDNIEFRFEILEKSVSTLSNDVAWIKERLGKLPTSAGLWGMVATSIGVSIAIIGAIIMTFQFKYQIAASSLPPTVQNSAQPIIVQVPFYQPPVTSQQQPLGH